MTVQQSVRIARLVKEVARLRRVLTRHGIERPKRRRTRRVAKPDPRQLAMFGGQS